MNVIAEYSRAYYSCVRNFEDEDEDEQEGKGILMTSHYA